MTSDSDTERTVVKTYVPSYQKAVWREHADDLGMSQSEFVKSMVQAGRRGFDASDADPVEPDSTDETPRGEGLDEEVLDALSDGYRSWDELVESLTEGIEDRLETTLQRLQRENRIEYNGRHGGYATAGHDGD